MTNGLHQLNSEVLSALEGIKISAPTDTHILAYLRRSLKMSRVVAVAERDAIILEFSERLGITVSDEEIQAAADAFRYRYKLLNASQTHSWLTKQKTTSKDWAEGIKMSLLTKKLEEYLFGEQVDGHYLNNREVYKRAAFSQILLSNETEAQQVAKELKEGKASFNAVALERSIGLSSRANAGFVGVRFFNELRPEIAQAMTEAKEGEVIGPIQTKLGYHIVRIEKWFPTELTIAQRKRMLATMLKLTIAKTEVSDRSEGAELLADSESFMGELSEDELSVVAGGFTPAAIVVATVGSVTASKQLVDEIQGE
jgi:parvulin-like peptidyl-prolyl isomerase